MRIAAAFLAIIIGITMNIISPHVFSIGFARPDIVILVLAMVCLNMGRKTSLFIAFTAGIISDPYIGSIIGFHALVYTIMAFGIIKVREVMYKDNVLFHIIIVFSATMLFRLIFSVTQFRHLSYADSLPGIFLSPVMTSFLYMIFYYFYKYMRKAFIHVRQ